MKKLIIFLALFLTTTPFTQSWGAVYKSNRSFTTSDEKSYSQWIKEKVSADIFSNRESPYYGIKTDCADAAFALRAIYAFENKLSFEFIDNSGRAITEESTYFDNVSELGINRLKALIEYIGENIGSEMLANQNTYPIELSSLRPGDLYITKWTNSRGQETRHVYIIKDILPTGDLLLYSSTQPRAVRPLLPRKGMPLHFFTEKPYGFKRFKGSVENYSLMEYEWMNLGEKTFFNQLKDLLKKSEDSLQLNIERRIENICVALTTRSDIVEMAIEEKKHLKKKCFSKEVFDELSTPSRDKNIIKDIERLRNGYKSIKLAGKQSEIDSEISLGLDYLIGDDTGAMALAALKRFCAVSVVFGSVQIMTLSMKSFFDRYNAQLISYNPNESLGARWGLEKESKICPESK